LVHYVHDLNAELLDLSAEENRPAGARHPGFDLVHGHYRDAGQGAGDKGDQQQAGDAGAAQTVDLRPGQMTASLTAWQAVPIADANRRSPQTYGN